MAVRAIIWAIIILLLILGFIAETTGISFELLIMLLILIVAGAYGIDNFYKAKALESARQKELERFRGLEIDKVDMMFGLEFERYAAVLLNYQGYKTIVTKGSGDMGADIVAERDGIKYAIQCKRYQFIPASAFRGNAVGRAYYKGVSRTAISDAVGAKQHYGCNECMVITNSYFSPNARNLAAENGCILIDRDVLASWIKRYHEQHDRL